MYMMGDTTARARQREKVLYQTHATCMPRNTVYAVVKLTDRAEVWKSIESGYINVNHALEQVIQEAKKVLIIVSCKETIGTCCMGYGVITSEVLDIQRAKNTRTLPSHWNRIARMAWVKIGTVPRKGEAIGLVPDSVGITLCEQIDASARTVLQAAGPSRIIKTTAAKATMEVAGLNIEEYTLIVLNRRRQQLRKVEALRKERAVKRKRTEAVPMQPANDLLAQFAIKETPSPSLPVPLAMPIPVVQNANLLSYLPLPQGQAPTTLQNFSLGLGSPTQFMR
eukprot:TRINITY_DN9794_c1_g3_i3.p1 TRINITY_DN9794_c1_g3~~TRINITY_DN9794_c1_g3_i3.p1  ORF type:complete len:281 (+),score=58.50 TRINITY_DN9794_c1_g3_i3:623-1465(+)